MRVSNEPWIAPEGVKGGFDVAKIDLSNIYSHTANVTFLSVMLGVWLNYNKSELSQLATASTFHDIGMINVLDIIPPRT